MHGAKGKDAIHNDREGTFKRLGFGSKRKLGVAIPGHHNKNNPDGFFFFDRQQEHAPDDSPVNEAPIFSYDGEILHTQFADMLVYAGYDVAGEEIDLKGRAAIQALTDIIEAPDARHDFVFEPGQIQIVDNRRLGHRRTAYKDWPEEERQRHLVRLWVRNTGRPFYHG